MEKIGEIITNKQHDKNDSLIIDNSTFSLKKTRVFEIIKDSIGYYTIISSNGDLPIENILRINLNTVSRINESLNEELIEKINNLFLPFFERAFSGEIVKFVVTGIENKLLIILTPILEAINTTKIIFTIQEIDNQNNISELVTDSENMYKILSHISSDGLSRMIINEEGNYYRDWYSDSFIKLAGYDYLEIDTFEKWLDLVHQDDKYLLLELIESNKLGQISNFKYRIIQKNGDYKWISDTTYPRIDGKENIIGFYSSLKDIDYEMKYNEESNKLLEEITLSREMIMEDAMRIIQMNDKLITSEMELQYLNSQKDKFFSIISHDLRNPISGIMSFADSIITYYGRLNQEELFGLLNKLKDTTNHVYKLLENLLEWSRIQRGKLVIEKTSFNLKQVVTNIIELLAHTAFNKSIIISSTVRNNDYIYADFNSINTIIRNLLNNAIKFTHQNGKIEISTENSDNDLILCIKDYGVGMAPDVLNKIFNIGSNVTTLGTEKEKGSGLGLILCKELIEANGGNIWVESEPNQGSCFYISISRSIDSLSDGTQESTYLLKKENSSEDKLKLDLTYLSDEKQQDFKQKIADYFSPKLQLILETMLLNEIMEFSKELLEFSEEYDCHQLLKIAKNLIKCVSNFEIDEIDDLIKEYNEYTSSI